MDLRRARALQETIHLLLREVHHLQRLPRPQQPGHFDAVPAPGGLGCCLVCLTTSSCNFKMCFPTKMGCLGKQGEVELLANSDAC